MLPFAEMKLARSFVAGCGADEVNAPICKKAIDLAHSFGCLAVGIGLDKGSDELALTRMGCDLGQGFLLGRPMPEERFVALLKQRATVAGGRRVHLRPHNPRIDPDSPSMRFTARAGHSAVW